MTKNKSAVAEPVMVPELIIEDKGEFLRLSVKNGRLWCISLQCVFSEAVVKPSQVADFKPIV